jgi:hypothetical protein
VRTEPCTHRQPTPRQVLRVTILHEPAVIPIRCSLLVGMMWQRPFVPLRVQADKAQDFPWN